MLIVLLSLTILAKLDFIFDLSILVEENDLGFLKKALEVVDL